MKEDLELISGVDFLNFNDDQWSHFLKLTKSIFQEIFPDEPYDEKFWKNQFLKGFPDAICYNWIVKNQETIVAYGQLRYANELDPAFEQNKNWSRGFLVVDQTYRRQKIALELISKMVTKAIEDNKQFLVYNTTSKDGWSFLEYLGGILVLSSTESYLDMKNIDWDKMAKWKEYGYSNIEGIQVNTYNSIPDFLLSKFCNLDSKILSLVPTDELSTEEITSEETIRRREKEDSDNDIINIYKIANEKNGELSGFTNVRFNTETQDVLDQGLTGVSKEYQNRGLGRMLKAEMLFDIKKKFPTVEKIYTANGNKNASMLKINLEMGYKPHSTWKHYELSIPKLSTKLKKLI